MKKIKFLPIISIFLSNFAYSITIDEAIKSAYPKSDQIIAARETLAKDKLNVIDAFSTFLPILSYQGQKTHANLYYNKNNVNRSDPTIANRQTQYSSNFQLNQNLFNGFSDTLNLMAAREGEKYNELNFLSKEQEFILSVVQIYLNLYASVKKVSENKKNFEYLQKNHQAIKAKFESGLSVIADLANSEAELALAQYRLSEAESNYQSNLSMYDTFIGAESTNLELPKKVEIAANNLDQLLKLSLKTNPEIVGGKHAVDSRKLQAKASYGDLLPNVGLQASDGNDNSPPNGISKNRTRQISLTVNVPIFNMQNYTKIQRASKESAIIEANYRKELLDHRNKVVKLWSNKEYLNEALKAAISRSKSSKIAVDSMTLQFNEGLVTLTDLLENQRNLYSAKINEIDTEVTKYMILYQIKALTGDLTSAKLGISNK